MQQQTILKKKKKKKQESGDRLLLVDYECLDDEEKAKRAVSSIENKLMEAMRHHIGKEEAITPFKLFEQVYGFSPKNLDMFTRAYWWNVLKAVLRKMRREGTLFVINRGQILFVLKTQEEADAYKKRIDADIKSLKQTKKNADSWVKNKKWAKLGGN